MAPDSRSPAAKAVGAEATWGHPGGQLLAVRSPGPEESPAEEWWSAQDRAKPLRLQHAIWHCGSSDRASNESTGAGPNSRISARPIVRRIQFAACPMPFIAVYKPKYTQFLQQLEEPENAGAGNAGERRQEAGSDTLAAKFAMYRVPSQI